MHRRFTTILRFSLLCLFVAGAIVQPQSSAYALTTLTVTPLTWNVIGLDSNNVSVGPNHFPIGARVCNSGGEAATNVTAAFVWDSADPYIALRPGTLSSINLGTLNAGACADAYFEVEVTRNSSAYDHTRDYHISVTAGNVSGTSSTPTPRELYVEHLISQNRNAVTDMRLDGVSVAPGGTMTLMVGQTYSIQLVGYTATQGYEQIEYFINFPNTIFQILSVSSTFDADSSATVGPSPINKLYGDNCVWENDPNSPNYRNCLSTGKTGGNITTTYQVKILQVPAAPLVNPEPLSTLIYDFSGSSFHYNADYGVSTRYANIVNASVAKSFSPKTINPNGTSTLTFSVSNPGPSAITGVNFTDDLPAGMTLDNNSVSYSGCGAALPATVSDPLSFTNITVAGYGTCTVAVTVSSAADGVYNNTSGNLFLGTTNTGSVASDSLIVSSSPGAPSSCGSPTTLATWDFSNYTAATSANNGPFNESSRAVDVTDANTSATYGTSGASMSAIVNTTTYPGTWTDPTATGNVGNSWGIQSGWPASSPADPTTVTNSPSTTPYFQFQVDASKYGGIGLTASYNLRGNWSNGDNWYVLFSTTGANGSWSLLPSANRAWTKNEWRTVLNPPAISGTSTSTGNSTVYFRVYASGAQNATAVLYLDTVQITGCPLPTVPNLSKSFAPPSIGTGNTSVLTFTLTNPNTTTSLPNVSFSDVLPAGLTVVSGSTPACTTGTLTTTAPRTISLSGGTLAASGTCTINVTVRGAAAGSYTNVSSSISSSDTGPNTTVSGYGTSSLTVIDPPVLAKSFTANPIFTGNSTSLDFDIVNPNPSTALTGVAFSDVLPAGLSVANGTFSVCGGTDNLTTTAATRTIMLLNTTIVGGGTCSFSVTVTGPTAGSYTNTTGSISSTNGGTGNTASANVLVKTPAPAINLLKQVGSTSTGPWTSFLTATIGSNVYYRFTVENTGDVSLSNVSVDDPTVSTAACSWTRGDSATPVTSPFSLAVADASNNQIATCVLGPISVVPGLHTNTATASGTSGSTVTKSSSATYGTPAITIAKSVTQTSFRAAGDVLNYSYLVTNSGGAPLPGPVTVSDDKVTVTCPAVSTAGDGDHWLDPADYPTAGTAAESITCTASYTVLAEDVTAGFVTNTASATVSGVTSNTDSKTVNGSASIVAPSIEKQFSPNPVAVNGVSTLTFSIINSNAAVDSTGVAFTDNLPAGMQVAATPNATTSACGSPTFAPASGNTTLTFSGGTIAGGATCTVSVDVVSTTAGTRTNTTGNVSSTNGGTGNTASAKLGVINALKTVIATSEDSSSELNAPRLVLIGEIVRYRLVIELPEGTTTSLQFVDSVVANMAYLNDGSTRVAFVCNSGATCASSSVAAIGANPVLSGNVSAVTPAFVLPAANISGDTGNPYGDGVNPIFSLGNVTNNDNDGDSEYVVIEFNTLVRNTTGNQDTGTRGNDFTVNVNGSALVSSIDNANSRITITEPVISTVTKSITTTPADAGDTITYQLQFTNTGSAPAFDIAITDTLNAVLTTPVTVSGSTTGGSCGSTASTVSGSYTAPTVSATVTCLAAGGTATVNITANVSNTALAGYTFTNAANLTYSSLPGNGSAGNPTGSLTPGGGINNSNSERTGSGAGANDYTASSNTVSTILASPSLAKSINPAGTLFAIGTTIPYQITVTVPEGVSGGPLANIVETIPTGLSYVAGSLTVTPQAGVTMGTAGPYTDANPSFFDLSAQTMTLTFGSFTSTASASATNRTVTIAFLARVDNVVGNQTGTSFTNSVDFVRTNPNGAGTLTLNATDASASVAEPALNVSKAASSATPAYNSTLTYTLTLTHIAASNSSAYDVQVTDTLPAGLTSLTNVNVSSTGSCATGVTNSSTGSLLDVTIGTIPLGCTVTIAYDVTVSGGLGSLQTNSVDMAWTSRTGTVYERSGVDGPGGALNDYADSDSEPVTVSGPDFRTLKTDGSATYSPGSPITYTITVNNNGNATATGAVTDTFSASLTGVTWSCSGTGGASCGASGSGNINDAVSIPAGQSVTYTINATVAVAATGNLSNTALATLSSGTDPTPGDNSSTDTDTPADLLPDAVADTNTATEGGAAVNGNVITNENSLGDTPTTVTAVVDDDGDALVIGTPFSTDNGGTLTINANGAYTYTPPATLPEGTLLTEVFTYTITDNDGDSDTATLTITVDRLPQANPDTNTATEGGANATGNVITNDDEGNTSATVTAAAQGGTAITVGTPFSTTAGGTLTLNANGSYTYTPPATLPEGSAITEVFNYTITDVDGDTSSSTLTITVDRLPQANPDTNTATEGGANATGNVITNDDEGNTSATVTTVVDDDGDTVSIGTPFTTDGGGTLTLNANGTYTYTPPAINLVPPGGLVEVFTYTITDADGDISSTTLTITVDDNDLVPDAVADTNTATEGGANVTGDVLTNENSLGDTPTTVTAVVDDDGDPLTLGIAFATDGGGSLTINADGTYTYTPPAIDLVPPAGLVEVFTYTITDVDGDPDTTTLTITINDRDRLPVATNNSYTINAGATASGNVMTDGTADTLGDPPTTVTSYDAASVNGGTVTVAANGTFTYEPNGFVGTDTFTYTITDTDGDSSTATVTIRVDQSLIGISKRVVSTTEVSSGTYDVTYELYLENFGTTVLNNIQVTEDLSVTFPAPTTFTVQSVNSAAFAENGSYNGSSAIDLLSGSDNVAVGASGNITLVVRVGPANAGPFQNTATVSGQCPTCTTPVTDDSQDGSDPDPDNDSDPTNDNDPTPLTFGPNLFDPPFGLKVVDASGLPVLQWTMVWINDSNIVAINAQVSDPISAGTSYAGGLTCVASGAITATTSCTYESPSGAYPRGRVIWSGNLGPDLGATDAASAVNEITITFNVNVNSGITSVQNNATIDSDLNGDNDITDPGEQGVASASSSWGAPPAPTGSGSTKTQLPATGFAPNVVTDRSNVPSEKYTATGDITVEIPSLKVKIPVVGVPKKDGTWNVSWLGNQAGWLEGSAFPSWSGNSVLTGHVYLSNGLPGPFVNVNALKYGDKIIVHAYGQKYTFEVRENKVVEPSDQTVMQHEDKSWLTLVTCKEYDAATNTYRKRVVVRAVLVSVAWE